MLTNNEINTFQSNFINLKNQEVKEFTVRNLKILDKYLYSLEYI